MKLSQILNNKKVMRVQNGELEEITQASGEITFYDIYDVLEEYHDKVIQNITPETSQNEIIFNMIPIISDIECDITLEEFNKKMDKPNKLAITLYDTLLDMVMELFNYAEKVKNFQDKSEKMINENPTIKESIKILELKTSKEKQVKELYVKLNAPITQKEKSKIIKQINKLENELGV